MDGVAAASSGDYLPLNMRLILVKVVLGVLFGALIGVLILGLLGLLLAGWEGMINGAVWGFFLGILGGIASAGIVEWSYWGGFMKRLGINLLQSEQDE